MTSRTTAFLVTSIGGAVTLAAAPAPVHACTISGDWRITQSNGAVVDLSVVQSGDRLEGAARRDSITGSLYGRIIRRKVAFFIQWGGRTTGEYRGRIDPDGRLHGHSIDLAKHTSQAIWFANTHFRC
ncbi:MAG TPA: hypothetical protein VD846_05195 [Allosphingosinicella sp.]|nr:hypothetical protein [Allosphingosinicella sp.]